MSLPRVFILFILCLFIGIFGLSKYKTSRNQANSQVALADFSEVSFDVDLDDPTLEDNMIEETRQPAETSPETYPVNEKEQHLSISEEIIRKRREEPFKNVDRVEELFRKGNKKLPIVETITYKSKVPWQKGRAAWLADYASHYKTSRHFIARSLNGKPDYFKQDIAEGDRFNVLHPEKNISFHLVIDTQLCKLLFYAVDHDTNEKTLIKTYDVGLGRFDPSKESGLLTPLGKYSLGDRVAVYQPGKKGIHNGEKIDMIRIFGTRWIPFDKEIQGCTEAAKGFGIHGLPWLADEQGKYKEEMKSLGKYESDGCIRLSTHDIEELYSIIISRPAVIEIVHNYKDAVVSGAEKP